MSFSYANLINFVKHLVSFPMFAFCYKITYSALCCQLYLLWNGFPDPGLENQIVQTYLSQKCIISLALNQPKDSSTPFYAQSTEKKQREKKKKWNNFFYTFHVVIMNLAFECQLLCIQTFFFATTDGTLCISCVCYFPTRAFCTDISLAREDFAKYVRGMQISVSTVVAFIFTASNRGLWV